MSDFAEYITRDGDRLDIICFAAYGDPYNWRPVLDANPSLPILDEYEGGIVLAIPIIVPTASGTSAASLPPWKRPTA